MGKSGAGKGKFDLDFILEKDEDFTHSAATLKASTGSFSKTTGSSGGRPQNDSQQDISENMDWFEDLKKGLLKAFKDFPALETPEDLFKSLNDRGSLDTLSPEQTRMLMTHLSNKHQGSPFKKLLPNLDPFSSVASPIKSKKNVFNTLSKPPRGGIQISESMFATEKAKVKRRLSPKRADDTESAEPNIQDQMNTMNFINNT